MREGIGNNLHTGRKTQIKIYFGKLFRIFINERGWKGLPLSAAIALMVAFVMGKSLFTNMERLRAGAFAMVCVCIWNGFFNSIQMICRERAIIKREHRAGLYISAYIGAHMLYQAIICMLQVIISLVIFRAYGMYFPKKGLITGNFTIDLAITMFLVTFAADMMALMVSCIAHTTTTAMTIMPFLLVVQLVFAGGVFPLEPKGSQYISNLTVSSWGIRAVNTVADYNGQESVALTMAIDRMHDSEDELMVRIHDVLKIKEVQEKLRTYTAQKMQDSRYEFKKDNLLRCWGVLMLSGAIYLLIGLLALEMIDQDKR